MVRCSSCIALALALGQSLYAQWQVVSTDHLPSVAYDGVAQADGSLRAIVNGFDSLDRIDEADLLTIDIEGTPSDTVELLWDGARVMGTRLYARPDTGTFFATGLRVHEFPSGAQLQGFVAEVAPQAVTMTPYGPIEHSTMDGQGFVDSDGSLVFSHYDFADFWFGEFAYWITRFCPGAGVCDSTLIMELVGGWRMHCVARLDPMQITGIMDALEEECEPYANNRHGVVQFSSDLEVEDCLPLDTLGVGAFGEPTGFYDHISMISIPGGGFVLSGLAKEHIPGDVTYPAGLQYARPGEPAIAKRLFREAPEEVEATWPGTMRGLSPFNGSTFAFAYTEKAYSPSPWPTVSEVSNVHVLRLDTSLNILGEFVFNGEAMDRYHCLNSVVAAPDGAVYIMGSVYDYGDATPRPKAWVARVAPEQFVSVPEIKHAGLSIAPNPGSDGFMLHTQNALPGAQIAIYDLHGRLQHTEIVTGPAHWTHVPALAGGIYVVRVTARDGSQWATRWVKQ